MWRYILLYRLALCLGSSRDAGGLSSSECRFGSMLCIVRLSSDGRPSGVLGGNRVSLSDIVFLST